MSEENKKYRLPLLKTVEDDEIAIRIDGLPSLRDKRGVVKWSGIPDQKSEALEEKK